MTPTGNGAALSDEIIAHCGDRAAAYDRENRFFTEDFEELRAAGYLKIAIPKELGGHGMSLADVCREQRRLAYRAPATALATNMHLYWTGVAADMRKMGDASLEWVLREAAAGEVFAAGHGEAGNDLPLFLSTAKAERADGGYKFWGHKTFSSLTPVWTRLGLHAMNAADPGGPKIVHAFLPREAKGYTIKETWDTLGMRATRSDDTLLDGAFIPDKYVSRVVPAGTADLFVLAIFGWAEPTFGSIYLGLAERARDIAAAGVKKRTSLALTRSMAYHPEVQRCFSDMQLALESAGAQVDRVAEDWSTGVDHGAQWPMKLVAAKHNAVEAAKKVVDLAMAVSGGGGMFKSNELERLYRDARCGGFHPANTLLVHEIVGKTVLGIELGEQPRWG
ncbi:MAG: acyl-CoA dehydrogenase family protein [Candidatus Rokubacteria bacterium]|nr:acyl-CoA dehydrogenase family protein [Candidatus Rokubacteria bacterium]